MSDYYRKPVTVLCQDGKVRIARAKAHCFDGSFATDTWFSAPALIRVAGKYVVGYVTGNDAHQDDAKQPEYAFRAMNSHRHLLGLSPVGRRI